MNDDSFADQIRRLHPAGPPLDAVQIAFAAGRRSARASTWRWRGVAGGAIVLAITLLLNEQARPTPSPARSAGVSAFVTATSRESVRPIPAPALDPMSLVVLQQRVIQFGLPGLPECVSPPARRPTSVQEFLDKGNL